MQTGRTLLLFCFLGSLLLLAMQQLSYDSRLPNLAIHMGSYILAAGFMAAVGMIFHAYIEDEISGEKVLQLAGLFYLLFVVSGTCRYWFTDKRPRIESLTQILILRKVPRYSEIYLAVLVMIGMFWLFQRPLKQLLRRPWLAGVIGAACIGVTFLPHELLGYRIIGSLLGTTEFNSLSILAFLGYFVIGFYLADQSCDKTHIYRYLTVAGFILTIGLGWICRYKLVKKISYPLAWWEILIPAGFVMLLIWFVSVPRIRTAAGEYHPKWYVLRMCLEIAALTIIKEYTHTAKLGCGETILMAVCIWVLIYLCCCGINYIILRLKENSAFVQCAAAYTVGFAIMAPAAFLAFIEEKRVMIWWLDGMSQYLPKAVWFAQSVRDLFHSLLQGSLEFKFYDFSFGMGDAVVPSLDPLYWLYAIFSPENMEAGYQWVTIFKLFLMGLSVLAMFQYFKKEKWASVLASYVYVFSGYSFYAIPRHPQFANPMILLPLLVIACEEILRKKKWYLGTILIGLSLLSNYYFFYINTLVLVVYFLVRFLGFEKERRKIRDFFSYLLTFAWAWILGVGLGSMTIFTSIMNYTGSDRSASVVIPDSGLFYYGASWPTDVFTFFITASKWPGEWFRTGFLPIAYLCLILLFLHKGWKTEKRLLVITFICSMLPLAGFVFNAMKLVSNRWTYVIALLISLVVAEMLPLIPKLTKKQVGILSLAVLPYLMIALSYEEYDIKIVLKEEILLIASLVVVLLATNLLSDLSELKRQAMLAGLMLLSVWLGGYTLYSTHGGKEEIDQYMPAGTAMERAAYTDIRLFEGQDAVSDDFYRVTEPVIEGSKLNASMILGNYGLSYYNSTISSQILDYQRLIGNPMLKLTALEGLNNRTAVNALACVRYYALRKDDADSIRMLPYGYVYAGKGKGKTEDLAFYENQYVLPVGYTYDKWISREDLEKYSEVERQEVMLTHAVIDDPAALSQQYRDVTPTTTTEKIEPDNINYSKITSDGNKFTVEADGKIDLTFEGLPRSETYLIIRGKILTSDTDQTDIVHTFIGSKISSYRATLYPAENIYEPGLESYVFNLGYQEEPLTACSVRFETEITMLADAIEIWCQPMDDYPQQIADLRENSLKNIEKTANSICGTVKVDEPKILTFSIPYAQSWHVYVDGREEKLLDVNAMYCGVELAPGDHTILIKYEPDAIVKGLIVTGVSLIIFIACIKIGKRRRKPQQDS